MTAKKSTVFFCIDKGNTRTKVGVFKNDLLIFTEVYNKLEKAHVESIIEKYNPLACILSDVSIRDIEFERFLASQFDSFCLFDAVTPVPVKNNYEQPETLGKDRLAAVVGAAFMKPNSDLFVVDAGTAITYDFIDAAGVFHGGNIAPGARMRAKALHSFTGRLPEIEADAEFELLGKKTSTAILSGIMNGVVFEINGYFEALKIKYPELSIFLTGGDANYFVSKLKSPIFAEKNLVLIGLNRILQFNVKK